eukprot:351497-Chlamydomonas_euryale.AAC.4
MACRATQCHCRRWDWPADPHARHGSTLHRRRRWRRCRRVTYAPPEAPSRGAHDVRTPGRSRAAWRASQHHRQSVTRLPPPRPPASFAAQTGCLR